MKRKRILASSNKTSLTFRKLSFCGLNSLTHSLTFIHILINQNHSLLNLFDAKSNLHIDVYKSSCVVYFIAWNIDIVNWKVLSSRRKCLSQLEVDNEVPALVRLTWYVRILVNWTWNKCPLSVLRDVYIKRVSLNRGLTVYFIIKLSKSSRAGWSRAIICESIDHGNDVTCHTGN